MIGIILPNGHSSLTGKQAMTALERGLFFAHITEGSEQMLDLLIISLFEQTSKWC